MREVLRIEGADPLAISGNGRWIAYARDRSIEFREVDGDRIVADTGSADSCMVAACGPDGRFAVFESDRVRFVDCAATQQQHASHSLHPGEQPLGITRDGHWIAVRDEGGKLRMQHTDHAKSIALPDVEVESIEQLAQAADGRTLFSAEMGPWGKPHVLAQAVHLSAWSLDRDNTRLGDTALRSLNYKPSPPITATSIAISPAEDLLFTSWHNLVRIEPSTGRILDHREGEASIDCRPLGKDHVVSSHIARLADRMVLRWQLRRRVGLDPILSANGLTHESLRVATAAPRFATYSGEATIVRELVSP